jgi:polyhydroxyalkanoate synthase
MSLVSKPYILDLAPNQSFVEYLVRQGFDVYMIDWGIPRDEDRTMRFEDYVLDLLPRAVERVRAISGQDDYSFLGYCFGGTLGLMYAMAFPREGLRNLVTVATPIDFSGMGLLNHWADRRWFDVDRVVDTFGNIPAEVVLRSLEMLRPLDRMLGYVRLWDNAWDPDFVYNWRLRYKWVQDQIPFPGETYRQLIKDLFWENKLINGELIMEGRRLSPGCVNASVFNIMAQFDHIAPYESTSPLTSAIGSLDKQDLVVRGGHVSLISGANAILRLWPSVNEWLSVRSV